MACGPTKHWETPSEPRPPGSGPSWCFNGAVSRQYSGANRAATERVTRVASYKWTRESSSDSRRMPRSASSRREIGGGNTNSRSGFAAADVTADKFGSPCDS